MYKQQSLLGFASPSAPSSPKVSSLDSIPSTSSDGTETEIVMDETVLRTDVCMYPNQPHGRAFPKKKFGQLKPGYRSFKESWFDNNNWSKWLHWEQEREMVFALYVEMFLYWARLLCQKARNVPL